MLIVPCGGVSRRLHAYAVSVRLFCLFMCVIFFRFFVCFYVFGSLLYADGREPPVAVATREPDGCVPDESLKGAQFSLVIKKKVEHFCEANVVTRFVYFALERRSRARYFKPRTIQIGMEQGVV